MKRSAISKILLASSAFAALALASNAASAAGFANRQQSATGMGFAYAGAGTSAWGIGSMFWNPANITNFEGRRSEWNVSLVVPSSSLTTTSVTGGPGAGPLNGVPTTLFPTPIPFTGSGDINQGVVVPASYNSYQVNNWLWLGLATGSPFGSTTKADAGFAGSVYGTSTKIKSTAITPTIGIKLNEQIAFGFGVTLQQLVGVFKSGDPRIQASLGGAAAPLSSNVLRGDGYGYGFTAGVTLKPLQGTEISLGFRSAIHHNLNGEVVNPGLGGQYLTKLKINTPESATLGIRQTINDKWTAVATAQWTNWSRIQSPLIINRVTGAPLTLGGRTFPFVINYKDEYFLALGAEYQHSPAWKFRAGVAYEKSPTDDDNRGVRVLDANRIWLSAGVGYKYSDKLDIELGYSHLFIKSGIVNIAGLDPDSNRVINYSGRSRAHADILSIAVKYRWDSGASSAAPIVKKF